MAALNTGREVKLHVVAQIVEAEFVIGAVGNVCGVGCLTLEVVHVVLDTTDFETEETMNLAHPLRVARSQVVVDGNHVDTAAASERVEISRESSDERLAFAGAHLRDFPLVQGNAADELHVEV